jgi:tripartite-type tricarboxylate transporter receptor subunit TctC
MPHLLIPRVITLALTGVAMAQAYSAKLIPIVNPFALDGNTDIVTRAIADRLVPALKQQVIVEPRPLRDSVKDKWFYSNAARFFRID